ncbi:ferrochelatase [bacterium]|nr:ferrochelatase [bacterium]MBU1957512.1 ferrochelatase [bacterium]
MKKALILLNMGGPNKVEEVEMFLRNMFADKNILPINRYLRKFVGNIIVRKRLKEVEENFTEYLGGKSPLPILTNKLISKLETKLEMPIVPAMRYVPPFATPALEKFKADGVEELLLFPMYPQYSTTTTLSSFEDIEQRCAVLGYAPKITLIEPYYDDYDYIKASYEKIMEAMKDKDTTEYDLLLSAHGLPVSIIKNGDPYEKQVESNVSALKIYLNERGVRFNTIKLVYQSKVGNATWLEPSLVDVLRNPRNRKVLIYPLAFTIDNSETVFELDIESRERAEKIKYDDFVVAKCFNDDDAFVDLIVKKVNEL